MFVNIVYLVILKIKVVGLMKGYFAKISVY